MKVRASTEVAARANFSNALDLREVYRCVKRWDAESLEGRLP